VQKEKKTAVVLGLIVGLVALLINIYTAFWWWPAEELAAWFGMSRTTARIICIAVPVVLFGAVIVMVRICRKCRRVPVQLPEKIAKFRNSKPLPEQTVLSRFGDAFDWLCNALSTVMSDIGEEEDPSYRQRRGHGAIVEAVQRQGRNRAAELKALGMCTEGEDWKKLAGSYAEYIEALDAPIRILNKLAFRSVPCMQRAVGCLHKTQVVVCEISSQLTKKRQRGGN